MKRRDFIAAIGGAVAAIRLVARGAGSAAAAAVATVNVVAAEAQVPNCQQREKVWSPIERSTWTALCEGRRATISNVESMPISSTFIITILTQSFYPERLQNYGINIQGARFTEPLLLNDRHILGSLILINCYFSNIVDLSNSHISGSVSFLGSTLAEGVTEAWGPTKPHLNLKAVRLFDRILDIRIEILKRYPYPLSAATIP